MGNYFVPGCSAKLLCCEQESAFPDPPIGAAMAAIADGFVQVNPAFAEAGTSECVPGSEGCCDTMIPPSFLPPDDSTCWQWWDPPADGVMTPGTAPPPKGCNYKPCEAAVCACDPYCCETAWDLSCRGYHLNAEDTVDNNYFVDGCSAKMLCCEPESAYPDPPVGGALPEPNVDISQVTSTSTATSTETSTATSSGTSTSTATLSPTVSPPIATTSPTMAIKSSKKGSKGKKGSKKGCKGKGKAGKAGKAGKKGSSAGTKMPKLSTSKGSKSKGSKSSKCPDPTSAPTPPVGSPTVSPTETTTSTSTSTSTATATVQVQAAVQKVAVQATKMVAVPATTVKQVAVPAVTMKKVAVPAMQQIAIPASQQQTTQVAIPATMKVAVPVPVAAGGTSVAVNVDTKDTEITSTTTKQAATVYNGVTVMQTITPSKGKGKAGSKTSKKGSKERIIVRNKDAEVINIKGLKIQGQ